MSGDGIGSLEEELTLLAEHVKTVVSENLERQYLDKAGLDKQTTAEIAEAISKLITVEWLQDPKNKMGLNAEVISSIDLGSYLSTMSDNPAVRDPILLILENKDIENNKAKIIKYLSDATKGQISSQHNKTLKKETLTTLANVISNKLAAALEKNGIGNAKEISEEVKNKIDNETFLTITGKFSPLKLETLESLRNNPEQLDKFIEKIAQEIITQKQDKTSFSDITAKQSKQTKLINFCSLHIKAVIHDINNDINSLEKNFEERMQKEREKSSLMQEGRVWSKTKVNSVEQKPKAGSLADLSKDNESIKRNEQEIKEKIKVAVKDGVIKPHIEDKDKDIDIQVNKLYKDFVNNGTKDFGILWQNQIDKNIIERNALLNNISDKIVKEFERRITLTGETEQGLNKEVVAKFAKDAAKDSLSKLNKQNLQSIAKSSEMMEDVANALIDSIKPEKGQQTGVKEVKNIIQNFFKLVTAVFENFFSEAKRKENPQPWRDYWNGNKSVVLDAKEVSNKLDTIKDKIQEAGKNLEVQSKNPSSDKAKWSVKAKQQDQGRNGQGR